MQLTRPDAISGISDADARLRASVFGRGKTNFSHDQFGRPRFKSRKLIIGEVHYDLRATYTSS